MADDKVIEMIAKQVSDMNERGLKNAETQGKMLQQVADIAADVKAMKEVAHAPVNCPNNFILKDQAQDIKELKKDVKSLSTTTTQPNVAIQPHKSKGATAKEYGLLSGIVAAIVAIAEVLKNFIKP